jgi:hypothetical protein
MNSTHKRGSEIKDMVDATQGRAGNESQVIGRNAWLLLPGLAEILLQANSLLSSE